MMAQKMKIHDIMTKDMTCLSENATLMEASKRMKEVNAGCMPVYSGTKEHLVGVITDRDLVVRGLASDMDPKTTPVNTIMTREVESIYEDDDISTACNKMTSKMIRRLIVLNRQNKTPVGIVAVGDIVSKCDDQTMVTHLIKGISKRTSEARR